MSREDEERERHFRNALSNYTGVLANLDEWDQKISHDDSAPVPEGWEEDSVLLLGEYLQILNLTDTEK
jgi:hypothetical protein